MSRLFRDLQGYFEGQVQGHGGRFSEICDFMLNENQVIPVLNEMKFKIQKTHHIVSNWVLLFNIKHECITTTIFKAVFLDIVLLSCVQAAWQNVHMYTIALS